MRNKKEAIGFLLVFQEQQLGDDGGHEFDRAASQAPLCEATNLYKTLHTPPDKALQQLQIIFDSEFLHSC